MKKDLAEEYIELIKIAREKKKANEQLYPIYKHCNTLLKNITTTRELRLDACLADEIIGEESKRIFLQCSNNITVSSYIELVSTNLSTHRALANAQYRGAYFPVFLSLQGTVAKMEKKPKKQRVEKDQERPDEKKSFAPDEIDAPSEIRKIFSTLKEKREIEVFRLVTNPCSFSKTVENILSLSFAVQVGRAFILERDGMLYVTLEKTEESKNTHCVISITEKESIEIARKMGIHESLL